MLSINNITPGFKIKFQYPAQNAQNKNNNFTLNFGKNNLSGMPHQDVFIKNTNVENNSQNITFVGNAKRAGKTSSKGKAPIEKVTFDDAYYNELGKEIAKKRDIAWDWMSTRQRYKEYFSKIKINKPNVKFTPINLKTYYNKKNYKPVNREEVTVGAYNWASNTILINKDTFPTMMLISNGKMAILPQNSVTDFIKKGDLSGSRHTKLEDYENLGERSLSFALENSKKSLKNNYYYKLSPKEAAELAAGHLAHDMEHAIVFHVLLNSSTFDSMGTLKKIYGHLKKNNKLPASSPSSWENSYPYKYKKTSKNSPLENSNTQFKITSSSGEPIWVAPLTESGLLDIFLRSNVKEEDRVDVNDPRYYDCYNDIELDAQNVAYAYLNRKHWIPTGYSPAQTEKLMAMLECQKDDIKGSILDLGFANEDYDVHRFYWDKDNEAKKKRLAAAKAAKAKKASPKINGARKNPNRPPEKSLKG